ncbi:hypothetical protein HW132_24750 [Brasilonema sp. CT11]|nr:hypothetical protein [Brasilonema sp. CT11]
MLRLMSKVGKKYVRSLCVSRRLHHATKSGGGWLILSLRTVSTFTPNLLAKFSSVNG